MSGTILTRPEHIPSNRADREVKRSRSERDPRLYLETRSEMMFASSIDKECRSSRPFKV